MATETDNLLDDVRAAAAQLEGGDGNNGVGGGAAPQGNGAAGGGEGDVSAIDRAGREAADQGAAGARARDEQGRFAKTEGDKSARETLTLKEKPDAKPPAGTDSAPPQTTTILPETASAPGTDKPAPILAPTEWKGAAKVKWDRLPREVQAEIVERHTAAEQARAAYQPLEQAIAPYKEAWTRDAGSVPQAIEQLGQFYRLYVENPVGLIHHIARTRGIDLGATQGQQPPQGAAPQQPPDIASLVSQVVQQHIAPIQERFAQTENQALNDTISAFASDPKHPFFQDVKVHMGQLLQAGAAKDLNEAYEQATWANPTIRAHLLMQQQEATKQQQAAEVEKANKARAASLRGSPLPGGASAGAGQGSSSVLDDVRAAAAEIAGA